LSPKSHEHASTASPLTATASSPPQSPSTTTATPIDISLPPESSLRCLTDDYDPLIIAAVRTQPPDLGAVQAVRVALQMLFSNMTREERDDMRDRAELALAVAELRAATLDQVAQAIRQITEVVAQRSGRPSNDLAVEALAGAIFDVMKKRTRRFC
jgi:hypothetical protein